MGLVEEFFAAASGELSDPIVDALPDEVCLAFELSGEGGGAWSITRTTDGVEVRRKAPEAWDCRICCDVGDFLELLDGDLDPKRGFLDGRLRIEGDLGLILRLWNGLGGRAGILAAK